jgi:hypothetical protein
LIGRRLIMREDALSDLPDPQPPVRLQRTRFRDEPELSPECEADPVPFDAGTDLPGAVLRVPNRHWGFEVVSATDHPGACTHYRPRASDAILVKGTDAEHVRNPRRFFFVDAGPENGLRKRTAFELVPRPFRLHRLKLLFPERQLGRLGEATLQALRAELARLHPEE